MLLGMGMGQPAPMVHRSKPNIPARWAAPQKKEGQKGWEPIGPEFRFQKRVHFKIWVLKFRFIFENLNSIGPEISFYFWKQNCEYWAKGFTIFFQIFFVLSGIWSLASRKKASEPSHQAIRCSLTSFYLV